ncbi:MAG: phenylalanine--tRNA ligase subunit beta [Blastocatellia bacterium]
MKISYNWLGEFIDIDLAPRDLAAQLTMIGHAVDAVEPHGDDHVLEIDLTSNRPDCLSHLGIAREVAALTGRPWRMPRVEFTESTTTCASVTSVEIANPELCPRYTARVIRDVKIGPSPQWLVTRLEAMGQRSINNVADITNYVMLETGQPLHAFDFQMLRGRRIIVRAAGEGEKMTTLDGEERTFTPHMLVITDAERAVAIGGVKGGEDSGISDATTDVLLEAAYFTPAQIRATSRTLGLATEASYRFERGTDPEIARFASDRATALIAEIAGGEILGGIIDVYPQKATRKPVSLRMPRYRAKSGLDATPDEAARILTALGFEAGADTNTQTIQAVAPTWRVDVGIEEDLIEEVARISGYDKLVATLPGSAGAGAYLPGENGRRAIRRALRAVGFHEAINFSFVNAETDALLGGADQPVVRLRNPIDETAGQMRTTLLGGLLDAVTHNFNHGSRHVRLFEIGKCFTAAAAGERPHETERLTLALTGAANENSWQDATDKVDFYDLRGALEQIHEALGREKPDFRVENIPGHLHPGRAAIICGNSSIYGHCGQLHPQVAGRFKFKQPVFIAELDLGQLLAAPQTEVRYSPLPKFPTVTRDLAVLIDQQIPWRSIESEILTLGLPNLVSVRLFDLYTGKELPPGKHSMALSVRYRATDHTLTDAEINAAHERIVETLRTRFSAEQR